MYYRSFMVVNLANVYLLLDHSFTPLQVNSCHYMYLKTPLRKYRKRHYSSGELCKDLSRKRVLEGKEWVMDSKSGDTHPH